jgi:hypothetical protein
MFTDYQKLNLETIINRLLVNDFSWLKANDIDWGDKGDHFILNYNQYGTKNKYNCLTRGLVIDKWTPFKKYDPFKHIRCFPFTRFFNKGEVQAATIDFANSDMVEKLDGTMVAVYPQQEDDYLNLNLNFNTRRMSSRCEADKQLKLTAFNGKEYNLLELIGQEIVKYKWDWFDADFTFIFEFIHPATQVITRYEEKDYGLYLIGCRNIHTLEETPEHLLSLVAGGHGFKRPRVWESRDDAGINLIMQENVAQGHSFEGFVFRDWVTGERVKLKSDQYVRLHHLLGELSYKNLVKPFLMGETEEIISYFPLAKERVDKISNASYRYITEAVTKITNWLAYNYDRKDLAIAMQAKNEEKFVKSLVFKALDKQISGILINHNFVVGYLYEVALGKNGQNGSPIRFLEIIKLHDWKNDNFVLDI